MSSLWRPLESLIRKLSRAPLFTLLSIVTLALGIGATSAIFSVVHGVLLKPLPFEEPEELVGLWHSAPGLGFETLNQAPAFHFTYRDEKRAFEDIGMWAHNQVTITGVAEPERVQAMRVTDGTFSLLRVRPAVGRIFSAEDDTPGSAETAIISHAYWQRRFGGDAGVVGRTLDINGRPTVIGRRAAARLPLPALRPRRLSAVSLQSVGALHRKLQLPGDRPAQEGIHHQGRERGTWRA